MNREKKGGWGGEWWSFPRDVIVGGVGCSSVNFC